MICQILLRGFSVALFFFLSVTLSVWIYLLEWCQENLCGIIHHIDGNNLYDSVLMQLTDAGGSRQLAATPDTSLAD